MITFVSKGPFTSIPVRPATLRRLKAYKVGGKTYDDVLNDLMEKTPARALLEEHLRILREEEFTPWAEVKKRMRRK